MQIEYTDEDFARAPTEEIPATQLPKDVSTDELLFRVGGLFDQFARLNSLLGWTRFRLYIRICDVPLMIRSIIPVSGTEMLQLEMADREGTNIFIHRKMKLVLDAEEVGA